MSQSLTHFSGLVLLLLVGGCIYKMYLIMIRRVISEEILLEPGSVALMFSYLIHVFLQWREIIAVKIFQS